MHNDYRFPTRVSERSSTLSLPVWLAIIIFNLVQCTTYPICSEIIPRWTNLPKFNNLICCQLDELIVLILTSNAFSADPMMIGVVSPSKPYSVNNSRTSISTCGNNNKMNEADVRYKKKYKKYGKLWLQRLLTRSNISESAASALLMKRTRCFTPI